MKIIWSLLFIMLTASFADKKANYLRLEIKELQREHSNLQQLIAHHQQQQQILTTQLEELGSNQQKLIKHLTRQNVKAEMRELVFHISKLLVKEQNLKQLLDRKLHLLIDMLWQKIIYHTEKIQNTQTNENYAQKQIAKVVILLREINTLDKNNAKISLPFSYESKWNFDDKDSIAKREEKKWLLIHCEEIYIELQKKLQKRNFKLKKRIESLSYLNSFYQRTIIKQKSIQLKIRSKNVSDKLVQINSILQKTKANLLAIQKKEQKGF